MSIFKTACRVLVKQKVYILVYVVFLGIMGVFVAAGNSNGAVSETFEQGRAKVAVVNRDAQAGSSSLAASLEEALADYADVAQVKDDERALQDAVAQGRANCLFIVPEGFSAAFMEAARSGDEPPAVQTVASFDDMGGFEAESQLQMYLSCAAMRAAADPQASQGTVAQRARDDMAQRAQAFYYIEEEEALPLPDDFLLYNRWSVYPILCAIGVLVAVVMAGFNRVDVRRRNLSAPVSSLKLSLGLAAAGVVCALVTWGWLTVQGLAVFGSSLSSVETWRVVLCVVDMLVYALFALSFGFLLSQLGATEMTANAASNISGLVLSFLGGAWMDVRLMGAGIESVSRFTPTYWHGEALTAIAQAEGFTWEALAPAVGGMALVLLFAAALFAVALVAGRLRLSNAGAKAPAV